MDTRINEWSKLRFVDPAKVLPQFRKIQLQVDESTLKDKVRNLRTQKLKQHREGWEAAIFCFGMSKMKSVPVYVAPYEASDYDAVAMRVEGNTQYFTPIQIKEVVPEDLNPGTDINKEIAKLRRYQVSNDTTVVIHVNRNVQLHLSSVKVPSLNIASLWLMGSSRPDQSKWFLAGNLLNKPQILEFDYPVA
ncbi:MAG: hypothetical protein HY883_05230 [Deltaproteobacteria bacterium]|nr:hypothetical protein [Deltaproteobacteria bacterium]